MKRFLLLFLLLTLTFLISQPCPAFWGLRNIRMDLPDSVYAGDNGLNADNYAFGISWARTEREDEQYTWGALDQVLDFNTRMSGSLVLEISAESGWATGGDTRAPDDIDRDTPLNQHPPANGYSQALYDFTFQTITYCFTNGQMRSLHIRYANEPQYNWAITDSTFERDVEDYIRCLRTVHVAAHHAAEDFGDRYSVYVSHGGIYTTLQLEREWFLAGEEDESLQDSLLTLFASRYERHADRLEDWGQYERRLASPNRQRMLYWADALAGQTDYLDWFDVHYHFKPRFLEPECRAFEQVVADSGGEVRGWLAAEAAMQLGEGSLTEYDPSLHAGDMARKWLTGKLFGLRGICTPIIGAPADHFFGLFDEELNEYPAANTYRFFSNELWRFGYGEYVNLSTDRMQFHRWAEWCCDAPSYVTDIVWLDADTDSDQDSIAWQPVIPRMHPDGWPEYFDWVKVISIYGDTLRTLRLNEDWVDEEFLPDTVYLKQEPVFLFWYLYGEGVPADDHLTPGDLHLDTIYPNPFNSSTTIRYTLPARAPVSLQIYNIRGQLVDVLVDEVKAAGRHSVVWDGRDFNSGVYFVKMETELRKLVLVK